MTSTIWIGFLNYETRIKLKLIIIYDDWVFMSKIKKKHPGRLAYASEENVKFEKIIHFSGWIFILILIGFLGVWGVLDLLNVSKIHLEAMTFSFVMFTGTSSALSFGIATKIRNNREKKKEIFLDWLIGEFVFCMFAIFVVAVYQW